MSLTRRLIFAQQPYHELSVVARDRGPELTAAVVSAAAASTARVRIHVTRVNQHEPQIHIRHLPQVIEQSQVRLSLTAFYVFKQLNVKMC